MRIRKTWGYRLIIAIIALGIGWFLAYDLRKPRCARSTILVDGIIIS